MQLGRHPRSGHACSESAHRDHTVVRARDDGRDADFRRWLGDVRRALVTNTRRTNRANTETVRFGFGDARDAKRYTEIGLSR